MVRRAKSEEGFGLVELMIAMTVLAIGLLAVAAGFMSGTTALVRADRISTAATLADSRMELYRAVQHSAIALDSTSQPAAGDPYHSDTALAGSPTPTKELATCPTLPPECDASVPVIGPDGRSYRVDTYVTRYTRDITTERNVKKVTVVVRDANSLSAGPLARQVSTFDPLSR